MAGLTPALSGPYHSMAARVTCLLPCKSDTWSVTRCLEAARENQVQLPKIHSSAPGATALYK